MAPDVRREVPKEVRLFTWARPQVSLYCLAQCALYALLGIFFPETQQASVMVIIGHLLLLASRECVACLADQTLARELYSYCWVAVYALVDGALWLVNRRSQLVTGLPAEGMIGIFVLAMLQGVYMRAFGVARMGAARRNRVQRRPIYRSPRAMVRDWPAVGGTGARLRTHSRRANSLCTVPCVGHTVARDCVNARGLEFFSSTLALRHHLFLLLSELSGGHGHRYG